MALVGEGVRGRAWRVGIAGGGDGGAMEGGGGWMDGWVRVNGWEREEGGEMRDGRDRRVAGGGSEGGLL